MENELGNPEWIGLARTFLTDMADAKTESATRLLASDVIYRVLGHHALSGEFSGRDGVATHLSMLFSQTGGRFDLVKFEDWMLGLSHVSIILDIDVEIDRRAQRLQHVILMRFNLDDRINEVTVFFSDLDVAERIYGRKPGNESLERN